MNTKYLTQIIISKQQYQSNNSLLFLSMNFKNLNVIHQSNIHYNINSFKNNTLVVLLKNYNRGELLNLKTELNSNGYDVNMMILSSNNNLYIDIINNQCLKIDHNLNDLNDDRFSNCVKMAEYFNFTHIHNQLLSIYNDRFSMKVDYMDELSSMMSGMEID